MSQHTTWYAVYSSNAFSTVLMDESEVKEALKLYPGAVVETLSSFEDACAWLETMEKSKGSQLVLENTSTGCVRTETAKAREETPYKRPIASGSGQSLSKKRSPKRSSNIPSGCQSRSPITVSSSPVKHLDDYTTPQKSATLGRGSSLGPDEEPVAGPSRTRPLPRRVRLNYKGREDVKDASAEYEETPVVLSDEQKHVLQMVLNGESVFFTGAAGTGKSVLLGEIIKELRKRRKRVAVTASTGIAAINIGGKTLHSFAGVGLGNQHANLLIKKAQNKRTRERWGETEVLIIDEVSMVDARWFDVLNEIGKSVRYSEKPFGGLQLVVCGDFFQLPPVPDQAYIDAGIPTSFAFEARCWNEAVPNTFTLTNVFRQKQSELVNMLNDMRLGIVSEESSELFYSLSREVKYNDGIQPTQIFPLRRLADAANKRHMDLLSGEQIVFNAQDAFGKDVYGVPVPPQRGRMILDKKVMPQITLKVGAQVMCIQNLPESNIVNGSIGVLVNFSTPQEARAAPEVILTMPNTDPNWKPGDKGPPPYRGQWEGKRWPVVRYQSGPTVMMIPFCFSHENADGGMEASRMQVPLILAWALTVHKAQGQTLERVKVDLEGTFEKGQAYVALSRCTTLEGLEVQHFSPGLVFAHPKVIAWARTLAVISDEDPSDAERSS